MRLLGMLAFVLLVALAGGAYLLGREEAPVRASMAVSEAMAGDTTGYLRAQGPRRFRFPEDHGPHPGYKTEWWYYTGNVATPEGRRFGYQFTIFRTALAPPDTTRPARASAWAADQLYMAHFTLSDIAGGDFHHFERFSRGAAGLAGAQAAPFRVWLEDWSATEAGAAARRAPTMRVQAEQDGVGVDLTLVPTRPLVLQGDAGYDRKGPRPGDASYYYSMTRLATEGTVTVAGTAYPVAGLSWMDREWSTSALGEGQQGWDWFSLHLGDGRDLMYYQIRGRDGTVSPFSDGVLVAPDGDVQPLDADDVRLEVLDRWTSPRSGAAYPSRWRLHIPSADLSLNIASQLPDQELDAAVRYWEGSVRLEGTAAGRPVDGYGYVEMTGYDETP